MEELLAEREALKQQIAALREQSVSGATAGEKALAQEQLKPLLDDFRTLSIAIASGQRQATPSPAENLERLDARGDVIRAGQPNENAPVVKMRDPVTKVITDMPDAATATAKATPSPVGQLEPIYDPNDPTKTRVIKMRDPATNTYVDVPDVAAGGKPTTVTGTGGSIYSWDGKTLTPLVPSTPDKPQIIHNQSTGAIYSWDGKSLTEHQKGKALPSEGQERANVKDGYNVTEKFVGGEWTTIAYGDPAKPGAPTEGKTRQNVKEGYNVTETYSGGDWTVTDVGKRATPREPTTLSAPADQRFIVRTDDQGNPVNVENPNWSPKTAGDIAARTGQLQTLAQQKKDEVMKKVSGTFTADQALAEFNSWWDQNVQPQTAALQAAAEEANFTRGKEIAAQRISAQQAANLAGTQAVSAYQASGLSRVGGGMADALKKAGEGAGALKDVDWQSAVFVPTDDPGSVQNRAKAATDAAYQTAMQGMPQYKPLTPGAELDRTKYQPTFPGGQPAPAAAAVQGGPAPGAAPDLFHATPTIVNAQGHSEWAYPMDVPVEAQQAAMAEAAVPEEVLASPAGPVPVGAYQPQVRRRPTLTPAPAAVPWNQQALAAGLGAGGLGPSGPTPVNQDPFYQQALAAGLGGGGAQWTPSQPPQFWPVGDETYPGPNPIQSTYVPADYLYGGQHYATPTPY